MAFTLPGSATAASVHGLKQAAADRMSGLSSPSNINLDYNGLAPAPGHVPSAWEQAGAEAVNDQISSALGASPDIQRQMHEADARRVQQHEDEYSHEVDLAGGRPGRIAGMEADIEGNVGARLENAHANAQFQPSVQALHNQVRGEKVADLGMIYHDAPTIAAQGKVAEAQAAAQGKLAEAQLAREPLPPEVARQNAIVKRYGEGFPLTDQGDSNTNPDMLRTYLGGSQPPQPPAPSGAMSVLFALAKHRDAVRSAGQQPQQP